MVKTISSLPTMSEYYCIVVLFPNKKLFVILIFQRGFVYTSKLAYSIIPDQGVVHGVAIAPTGLQVMPPITEANKGTYSFYWFMCGDNCMHACCVCINKQLNCLSANSCQTADKLFLCTFREGDTFSCETTVY